jgi:hypothetical protein
MSNETRALTMIGNKVQATKAVSVNGKTSVLEFAEKNSASSSPKKVAEKVAYPDAIISTADEQHGNSAVRTAGRVFMAVSVLGILVAAAIFAYRGYLANTKSAKAVEQHSIGQAPRATSSYTNEELSEISSKANANLPRMVDKDTRLDFTIGVSDSFQYNYTLVNNNSEDISFGSLTSTVEKSLVKWVCTTKSTLDDFIKRGVTVSFAYFGNDRRLIGVISVDPSQCA